MFYNLGVMGSAEWYRELAMLKVLGFRDKHIGRLLISQNVWLTVIGGLLGILAGVGVRSALITALTSSVSLLVGLMISRRNKEINMVEA